MTNETPPQGDSGAATGNRFTSGPWRIGIDETGKPHTIWGGENCRVVAGCWDDDYGDDAPPEAEATANAILIAAAPCLLAALGGMVKRYTELVNCGDCGNWDPEAEPEVVSARAAIAKATQSARQHRGDV